jgi:arylsulfotransferase ASST
MTEIKKVILVLSVLLICSLLSGLSVWSEVTPGDPGKTAEKLLTTLPYLSGYVPAKKEVGVIMVDSARAFKGLNFYISGDRPAAYLLDMTGKLIHEWSLDSREAWPDRPAMKHWRKAHLFKNGDILAIYQGPGSGLVRLDRESKLLWKYRGDCNNGGPHHDLDVADDGRIFLLTSRRVVDLDYKKLKLRSPIMEDYITVLNRDGEEIKSFSIIDAFLNSDYSSILKSMRKAGDIFHTNTIEILKGGGVNKTRSLPAGGLLISIPHLDTIAVITPEEEKVVWAMSKGWEAQHQPTLLDNGNILIFDNKGNDGNSRVIEVSPLSGEIIWQYQGDPPESFLSKTCGSNQRLPNGNTLITDTEAGRAFEVTPEGEVVWDFINPHRAGEDKELTASLFDLIRLETIPTFINIQSEKVSP